MLIRLRARSARLSPSNKAVPYSVTTYWTCARVVVTAAPGISVGTMREICPSTGVSAYLEGGVPALVLGARAVADSARIARP